MKIVSYAKIFGWWLMGAWYDLRLLLSIFSDNVHETSNKYYQLSKSMDKKIIFEKIEMTKRYE